MNELNVWTVAITLVNSLVWFVAGRLTSNKEVKLSVTKKQWKKLYSCVENQAEDEVTGISLTDGGILRIKLYEELTDKNT